MDSDLISRKALMSMHYDMKYTEVKGEVFVRLEDVVNCIKLIPTVDAVEVVRCKDCKHYEETYPEYGYCYRWDYEDGLSPNQVEADDFCSNGAKMDGGDK